MTLNSSNQNRNEKFNPATLAAMYAPAEAETARAMVTTALENFPGRILPQWIDFLTSGLRNHELGWMHHVHCEMRTLRLKGGANAHHLANFIEFQAAGNPSAWMPFTEHAAAPSDIGELYQWAAAELYEYGLPQARALSLAAQRLLHWCQASRIYHVAIIESPLGATLPALVIAETLRQGGILVDVHEFLAPRRAEGRGYSIKEAAKSFCRPLRNGSHPILFPDEVISGTRFLKLHKYLKRHLDGRLIPVALQGHDWRNPSALTPATKARLEEVLFETRIRFPGAPTHFQFPPAVPLHIDNGAPFVASNVFFWSDLDLCAGKRKVNLLFALLNEVKAITDDLKSADNGRLILLCQLWRFSASGEHFVGHEDILRQVIPELARRIDWSQLESEARREFQEEYLGNLPELDDAKIAHRLEWILDNLRKQIDADLDTSNAASDGWMFRHAVSDLFGLTTGRHKGLLPPDRDFCEYTLPFAAPFIELHEELVRLVVQGNSPRKGTDTSSFEQRQPNPDKAGQSTDSLL
ncbi:hypothetical protein P5Y53_19335 [Dyella jiangningensis]|uniref:hypothetical protein n=1 Tax=Dyella jiangningensis TaxID=1379159 RepID=UPI0024108E61|nr:hypothetical protein [Dyella jiangningensis]MDG2539841.1 hypothetical protein [Dyella jiangningensis]